LRKVPGVLENPLGGSLDDVSLRGKGDAGRPVESKGKQGMDVLLVVG